ncbi:MAG: hypothetical protein EBT68_03840 [Verrucomicrobia bacterium]|nr:hypothetical protein [Verrucomicrobiota bacterium]
MQVFPEMSAAPTKNKNRHGNCHQSYPCPCQIPSKRLPLGHPHDRPEKKKQSQSTKKNGKRLKNAPELLCLLPATKPCVPVVSQHLGTI